jgi:hypothetical protein
MRGAIDWARERFYRLLGGAGASVYGLYQTRIVWLVLVILLVGAFFAGKGSLRALSSFRPSLRSIHELSSTPLQGEIYIRVRGWAYRRMGYEYRRLGTRQVTVSYYLLLDRDTHHGILVRSARPLWREPYVSKPAVVTGRLAAMDDALLAETIEEDDWGRYDIVLSEWILVEGSPGLSFLWLSPFVLVLCILGFVALLLMPRYSFVVFRAGKADAREQGTDRGGVPLRNVDLRLTGTFSFAEPRRRVKLREVDAHLLAEPDGLRIRVQDRRKGRLLDIRLTGDSVEGIQPGELYFGGRPRSALEVSYREAQGSQRLYMSFDKSEKRWVVYDALDLWARPVHPAPTAAEES